jgi:hypothetical protein
MNERGEAPRIADAETSKTAQFGGGKPLPQQDEAFVPHLQKIFVPPWNSL